MALKVGIWHNPPMVTKCAVTQLSLQKNPPSCHSVGLSADLFGKTLDLAGIQYTLVDLGLNVTVPWGSLNATTKQWEGMLGLLQSGVVDTFANPFSITKARMEYFEFSYPVYADYYSYISRKPEVTLSALAARVFSVFTPDFYMAFLTTVALMTLVATLGERIIWRRLKGGFRNLNSAGSLINLQRSEAAFGRMRTRQRFQEPYSSS